MAAVAVTMVVLTPSPAMAQGAFSDDDGTSHEAALDSLAARGVLAGTECGQGRICPKDPISRWTVAVWLTRVLDNAEPAGVSSSRFADVDAGLWWAAHVERFAALGVTTGCRTGPLRYCPNKSVTRGQMAAFLNRAFALPAAEGAGFTDTAGHRFEDEIDALAAAGITTGCSTDPLRYCPNSSVTRGQMAAFITRALNLVPYFSGDIEVTPVGRGVSVTSEDQIILELQPSDVEPANLFDLSNRTLVFTPNGKGEYSRQVLPLQWDPNDRPNDGGEMHWYATEIELQDFRFEFSGRSWSSFHLPSQGVITFGGPLPRSDLVRGGTMPMYAQALTETAIPAIGVLYKQALEASRSVVELPDRVIITYYTRDWTQRYRGRHAEQTFDFQILLHSDGRIAFNYGPNPTNPNEWIRDGVVGLFPTDSASGAPLVIPNRPVDLSLPDSEFSSQHIESFRYPAIRGRSVEPFNTSRHAEISCRIIEVLGDEFDFVAFQSQSRFDQQEAGLAPSNYYSGTTFAEVQGTGQWGHESWTTPCKSKLKTELGHPVWMESHLVVGEEGYMRYGGWGPYVPGLTYFAHEISHVWLAKASYSRNGEQVPLQTDGCRCHWMFELHTPAPFPWGDGDTGSIQGGAFWREYPDGSFDRFEGWGNRGGGFSWLDLYLMGLAAPDEVPDTFIVRDVKPATDRQGAFTGTKEVITIEQVIAATGVRTPPAGKAPTAFNMGFVYVVLPGETVDPELLREHADYRDRAVEHWHHITGGRGQLTTTLP